MGINALLDMLAAGYGFLDLQKVMPGGNALVFIVLYGLKIVINFLLKYFEICCEGFEKLIFQDGYIGAPGWISIVLYGVLILIAASNKIIHSAFFSKDVIAVCS